MIRYVPPETTPPVVEIKRTCTGCKGTLYFMKEDISYKHVVTFDVDDLEPYVVCPKCGAHTMT